MSTHATNPEGSTVNSAVDAGQHTGRHPINTGHLVMGLVFAGLVGIWALMMGDVVADDDIRWLLPIPWVAGGAIGLAAATYANVRSRRSSNAGWVDDHTHAPAEDSPTEVIHSPATDDTDPTEEIR